MKVLRTIVLVTAALVHTGLMAQEYSFSIQPVLSKDKTIKTYQPLADYLTEKTGHKITIKAHKSFFSYWQKIRVGDEFDFVLDDAHFTDYRIQNYGYTALAKIPDTVSYSLVTHKILAVSSIGELALKRVASTPSPGLGGISLYEIFDDPSRLPRELTVNNSQEAVNAIVEGKVDAAIIPTSLVEDYDFLKVIKTTKKIPHMAISVSPAVPKDVVQSIQEVLDNASQSAEGQLMLGKISTSDFVKTNNKEYFGYSKLLSNIFGYQSPIADANTKEP